MTRHVFLLWIFTTDLVRIFSFVGFFFTTDAYYGFTTNQRILSFVGFYYGCLLRINAFTFLGKNARSMTWHVFTTDFLLRMFTTNQRIYLFSEKRSVCGFGVMFGSLGLMLASKFIKTIASSHVHTRERQLGYPPIPG